ncbi:MAG: ZIP family metal transporter [Candidatus Woesearchaeota archaeon]
MNQVWTILFISIIGPLIGSLIGIIKRPTDRFMFNLLAFAAGVMTAISFLQLIPQSIQISSIFFCILGVTCGSVVMFLFDKVLPYLHPFFGFNNNTNNAMINKNDAKNNNNSKSNASKFNKFEKTTSYLLFGIFLHNFPEGLAIGIGYMVSYDFSILVAIAISIHDIPEGICTSAPYYYITNKRMKSFIVSILTIIPTILGFILAYFFLEKIIYSLMGFLIALTAGIMIYISADELLPSSSYKVSQHKTIMSFIAGILLVVLLGAVIYK